MTFVTDALRCIHRDNAAHPTLPLYIFHACRCSPVSLHSAAERDCVNVMWSSSFPAQYREGFRVPLSFRHFRSSSFFVFLVVRVCLKDRP
ncbi:hypothetical protein B0H12DRAFT_1146127 [Mycena haematopus]|nr:hypothetical protein B0H12DRAFT_1146127 [Mycena haematopus]